MFVHVVHFSLISTTPMASAPGRNNLPSKSGPGLGSEAEGTKFATFEKRKIKGSVEKQAERRRAFDGFGLRLDVGRANRAHSSFKLLSPA